MIINDRIRNMSESEKMDYFLTRLTEDISRPQRDEIINQISKLTKGVDIHDFLTKFNLKGEFNYPLDDKTGKEDKQKDPTLIVHLSNGTDVTIDITDIGRNWFKDPVPVKPQPARSILPKEELDELNHV